MVGSWRCGWLLTVVLCYHPIIMATIILTRHGQNDWVKEGRLAGWIPGVHLNDAGIQQATDTAARLGQLPIRAVYSSPIDRCMETATIIAATWQLDVIPLEAIGEVRYGEWEGEKIKELAKTKTWHTVQYFPSRMRFPGGESFCEVQQRAVNALETLSLRHEEDMIVVVSHADVIKLLLAHYLGIHIDLFQRIAVAPASVSVLHLLENGAVRVERVNDDGPLRPPPAKPAAETGETEPSATANEHEDPLQSVGEKV